MSAASAMAHRWKPIVLTVLFGAAEAFFINKVSGDDPEWWWWPLVALALIGAAGSAIWGWKMGDGDNAGLGTDNDVDEAKDSAAVTQQTTGEKGRNVSVSADNGSFAAYRVDKINDLTIGEPPKKGSGDPSA
jgi:hypothetical protein